MGGGLNAKRMTSRDAEDALAALRLLPSRAEQSLDHRGSIILGVKTNPLLRPPAENFASNRRDHTRSVSSLPGVALPLPPSTLKELERRQRQPQQRVYRDPLTGEGIRNSWEDAGKPVYFSALEVPFGAKGSKARKAFTKEVYDKPRTLKSAGAALNAGEDSMYLQPEAARMAARGQDDQDPAFAWPAEGSLTGPGASSGNLRRASTASEIGPSDFWAEYAASEPEKLEKAGYVMRLGGAGNIRPRAPTPPAPLAVTQERLATLASTSKAKLHASRSQQLSMHKAQKKVLRLEYQLYREQQLREQAHRELDATLATVPAYGVDLGVKLTHLDLGAISMRRARSNSSVSAYTSNESREAYDKAVGAAGGLGQMTADAHRRPQKSRSSDLAQRAAAHKSLHSVFAGGPWSKEVMFVGGADNNRMFSKACGGRMPTAPATSTRRESFRSVLEAGGGNILEWKE